ncbi:MAG: hypothetical protein ABJB86_24360 [Bacteroidota bacterium]
MTKTNGHIQYRTAGIFNDDEIEMINAQLRNKIVVKIYNYEHIDGSR